MGSSSSVVHTRTIFNAKVVATDETNYETAVETTYANNVTVCPISNDLADLEKYFMQFRRNIVGIGEVFVTPYGPQKLVYCDWTASAR